MGGEGVEPGMEDAGVGAPVFFLEVGVGGVVVGGREV